MAIWNTESNREVVAGFLAGLMPPPRIDVSEWSDTYRMMTSSNSPEPGLYKTSRTPYLKKIMDCLSPYNTYEEVVFKKSSQVGATQAANNWIGAIIHLYNAPTLMVLPNEMLARTNSKNNIDEMIKSSPVLRERIGNARERDSGNTVLDKRFPGGFVSIRGAESPNNARSTSFRNIYLDELSAYPVDSGGEGDPYDLFVGRSKAFGTKRKIFSTSTPTTEGVCRISSLYEETDKQRYHIPCPHCGHVQTLDFDRLRWTEGKYGDVYYECVNQGCFIYERHKPQMLAKGEWIATVPSKSSPRKIGFHISALYTPLGWYSWAQMAEDYDKANNADDDNVKLKTFTNLMLGETWSESGEKPNYEHIMNRAIDYKDGFPTLGVGALSAGVDIQKNRIEIEVLGWGTNKSLYSVDYKVLEGDTEKEPVWQKLAEYLDSDFERPDGSLMKIKFTCIDSGYLSHRVYEFCDAFGSLRCVPVKGGPDSQLQLVANPKTVDINKDGVKVGSTMLRMLGVSLIKEHIYSRLKLFIDLETGEVPVGMCFFPKERSVYYFKGLCSEAREKINGKLQWVKKVERNEPLDLRVYAYMAGYLEGWTRQKDQWFLDEIARYVPDRKEFTQKKVRERRPSEFL